MRNAEFSQNAIQVDSANKFLCDLRDLRVQLFSCLSACFRGEKALFDLAHRQLRAEVLSAGRYGSRYDRSKRLLILRILLRQRLYKGHILLESLYLVRDVGRRVLVNQVETLLIVRDNKCLDYLISLAVQG